MDLDFEITTIPIQDMDKSRKYLIDLNTKTQQQQQYEEEEESKLEQDAISISSISNISSKEITIQDNQSLA